MVNRCVCHDVPFSKVRALRDRGMSLAQISEETKCCTGCGTCRPYILLVMATGRTSLPVLTAAQVLAIEQANPTGK